MSQSVGIIIIITIIIMIIMIINDYYHQYYHSQTMAEDMFTNHQPDMDSQEWSPVRSMFPRRGATPSYAGMSDFFELLQDL